MHIKPTFANILKNAGAMIIIALMISSTIATSITIIDEENLVLTNNKCNSSFASGLRSRSEDKTIPTSNMQIRSEILFEGFEEGIIPPTGWAHIQYNPVETWEVSTNFPHSGSYLAMVDYDSTYTDIQDEWLITPTIDFRGYNELRLSFWWQMSYYWSVSPNDNYDFNVSISIDNGENWSFLWNEHKDGEFDSWEWYETVIDLSNYTGEEFVKIGFQYSGYDGAPLRLDDVRVFEVVTGKHWIPFILDADPGASCELLPKSRDTTGLCVDSNFYGMYVLNATVNYTNFHRIDIPNAAPASDVGNPAVPVITRYLEIPHNIDVNLSIIYTDEQVLDGYYVIPAQEPHEDYENATIPPFTINMTTYTTDAFYPSYLTSIDGENGLEPIIIRGVRIVVLNLYPVQFNPVTHQIKIYSKIEVRINYNTPAQVEPVDTRLKSQAFNELCHGTILNYQYRPVDQGGYLDRAEGAEYLIITHDDFYRPVKRLADWKEKKGVTTKIVNTSEIAIKGPNVTEITEFIQNAYDTWNPAPTYLLLVGDSDRIPVEITNVGPSCSCYINVDGGNPDFEIPDIFMGRISVDTEEQANITVNKTLNYERNPPADPGFYSSISVCAQFEDKREISQETHEVTKLNDGYENRAFVYTSEALRDHLLTEGYDVERIYTALNNVNPTNYNPAPTDLGPVYDHGDPLPPELLRPVFAWDGDNDDITDAINEGRFLITHRDHGSSLGWGHPSYKIADIGGLTNGDLLPVVYSINCLTGRFIEDECFCEEFLRKEDGGAVAIIGSTVVTYSTRNDPLIKGFIDATWPSFDLNLGPHFTEEGMFHLGQILAYGKDYMVERRGRMCELTYKTFHLFGDPELEIWTAAPEPLVVTHPEAIGSEGLQKLVVNVENNTGVPVEEARVCLRKSADIYEVRFTNEDGEAIFDITPTSGGEMDVTVTRHNYRMYESIIDVTSNGAEITISPMISQPGEEVTITGNNFESEIVGITFPGTPTSSYKEVVAAGGNFATTMDVPSGSVGYCNVNATGQFSSRSAVTRFYRLPDEPLPDLYIYTPEDPSTWHLNPEGGDPIWDNPCVRVYDTVLEEYVDTRNLLIGREYILEALVYLDEPVVAENTNISFRWAVYGVGGRSKWHDIGYDFYNVHGPGLVYASEYWTPEDTGLTCIHVRAYHPWDFNVENNQAWKATNVQPISSPAVVNFSVTNPTDAPALIYLDLVQHDRTKVVWDTEIQREYPQVLNPNETKICSVVVNAPTGTPVGENRTFEVTGYINGEIIGGVEFEVVKDNYPYEPTNPIPEDNATDVPLTTYLSWVGGDPDLEDTVYYDIYFGTTSPPPLVEWTWLDTIYPLGTLDYNTIYYWQIVARDNHNALTPGSIWKFTTIMNNPPDAPSISGETDGKAGEEYEYTLIAIDPEGHDICFFVEWGDDTSSGWTDFVASETEVKLSHTWDEEGTYIIKAKAKDIYGAESDWGTLEVEMPVNKAVNSAVARFFILILK